MFKKNSHSWIGPRTMIDLVHGCEEVIFYAKNLQPISQAIEGAYDEPH